MPRLLRRPGHRLRRQHEGRGADLPAITSKGRIRVDGASARHPCRPLLTQHLWRRKRRSRPDPAGQVQTDHSKTPAVRSSVSFCPRGRLRRVRTAIERIDRHLLHQAGDPQSVDRETLMAQEIAQHPTARERIVQMQLVHPAHDRQVDGARRLAPPSAPKTPAAPSSTCVRHVEIWLARTSNCCARSASAFSPSIAASATRALNAALRSRRRRLPISSPVIRPPWPLSGR